MTPTCSLAASHGRLAPLAFARRASSPRSGRRPRLAIVAKASRSRASREFEQDSVAPVRHSMRVTRLRDLVEISPDLWDPQRPSDAGDGLAQAEAFKAPARLPALPRVQRFGGARRGRRPHRPPLGAVRHGLAADGGPRRVARVTRAVCEMDFEFISHVPEYSSGMMVAEMTFPLPALRDPEPRRARERSPRSPPRCCARLGSRRWCAASRSRLCTSRWCA